MSRVKWGSDFVKWGDDPVYWGRYAEQLTNPPEKTIKIDVGNAADLPPSVEVQVETGEILSLNLTWDNGTPVFNPGKAGAYRFRAVVSVPDTVDARGVFNFEFR